MKEFVMGARIEMADGFSSPVSHMTSTTQQFSAAVHQGDTAAAGLGNSTTRASAGFGRFAAGSRAATMSIRGMVGGVSSLTTSMLGLNSAMGAVMGIMAFKVAYDWLVGSNAEMEQYKNTLSVVLKSSERATEVLEWASKFAAQTPFEIPQIVEATTRLESYGISAQKTLGTIGDMSSVMGKPLMQAVEAVADAQTGEVERLKEFGITKDMLIAQGEKMGTTVVNNKGQITDQVAFNAALFTLMEERYKGGMDMQSKSFKGMLSNVSDFVSTMGREFGKPIFERLRAGLAGALGFLDKIKESGVMEAITAKAQAFGNGMADVFGFAFGIAGRVISEVANAIGRFIDANAPRFQAMFSGMGAGFSTFGAMAMPILNWLIDSALPLLLDGLGMVGGWVVQVAEFFITNWSEIQPFIMGIAAAFVYFQGPMLAIAGYNYAAAQATKVWAMAQAALNAVMAVNPIFLTIVAVGLLIGAAIWLAKNWDTIGPMFTRIWDSITQPIANVVNSITGGFISAYNFLAGIGASIITFYAGVWQQIIAGVLAFYSPVISAFTSVGQGITDYFGGLISQAFNWGGNIIDTMLQGVVAAKDRLVGGFTSVFSEVRKLMPFSDAKEGPFSELTYSGGAIMSTMAEGVDGNKASLYNAMDGAFSAVPEFSGTAGIAAEYMPPAAGVFEDIIAPQIGSPEFTPMAAPQYPSPEFTPMAAPQYPSPEFTPMAAPQYPSPEFMPMAAPQYPGPEFMPMAAPQFKSIVPTASPMLASMATPQLDNSTAQFNGEVPEPTSLAAASSIQPVAPPAPAPNVSKTVSIATLIGTLTISGVGKDAKEMADEFIEILHERLAGASEIASADMGGLL